jgi:hypothetical protein
MRAATDAAGTAASRKYSAAARGNHGGRPKVIDDDMLTFAIALKNKGVPVPEIAGKLVIKTGKNVGKPPRSPRCTGLSPKPAAPRRSRRK